MSNHVLNNKGVDLLEFAQGLSDYQDERKFQLYATFSLKDSIKRLYFSSDKYKVTKGEEVRYIGKDILTACKTYLELV